jgi:hypothetical protein
MNPGTASAPINTRQRSEGGFALTPRGEQWYRQGMDSELGDAPAPTTIDLTGLPEPVVKGIKPLVESLRIGMTDQTHPGAKPHRPPLRGRFADLKLSIPKEDLDEARREAWENFPREFPPRSQATYPGRTPG